MASEILEKVKIEIRSILLSSKHGVAADSIRSDYELLMCQKLPLKELGFKDVQSLMRAIPDVAKEVRSYSGEVTYHAVCDESTAHIKKLVSNQKTQKKKFTRGRGNRHGPVGRGGFSGRGAHFPGRRGSSVGDVRQYTSSPRTPHFVKRGRQEYYSPASGDSGDGVSERWRRVRSTEPSYVSATNGVYLANTLRTIQGIVGQEAAEPLNSHSGLDSNNFRQKSPLYNLKIGVSPSGRREISTSKEPHYDLRDLLSRKRAPAVSGQDVESPSSPIGRHVMATAASSDSVMNKKVSSQMKENREYPKNPHSQENRAFHKNLPPRLQRLQQQSSSVHERQVLSPVEDLTDLQLYFSVKNTVYSPTLSSNWVPPKDGHLYVEAFNNYFAQRREPAPEIEILPGKIGKVKGFYGRLRHKDKYYYPLEIMQNEEFARQNVVRVFCEENGISLLQNGQTQVSTTHSPSDRSHAVQDKQLVPSVPANSDQSPRSELNNLNEQCQEQLARIRNTAAVQQKQNQIIATDSSSTSHTVQEEHHVPSVQANGDQSPKPELNGSYVPGQEPPPGVGNTAAAQHKPPDLPETLKKVYKILKPNGIWLSNLPAFYKSTYGENLTLDILPVATQWPQYFTIEQLAGDRHIIYPVANDIPEATEKISAQVPVPRALQPAVGSKLQVFFSFAYSAEDLYLQRADMEDLLYEIDGLLNENCPNSSPPEVEALTLNSFVAASYEQSWYRAQVLAVEKSVVKVYFIDYGNNEKVSIADLRPIPQDLRILKTPSLAIRCALRKTKAGEWKKDVFGLLTGLSETNPTLSAEIVEHKVDQCIVDLYALEGSLVNDMLIQSVSSPAGHPPGEVGSAAKSVQQGTTQIAMISPAGHPPREVGSAAKSVEQGTTQIGMISPAGHPPDEVGSAAKSVEQGTLQTAKTSPLPAAAARLFADDPGPLELPDSDAFAVYVCRVMSENTVLLRVVDDEYSDKLDELEQDIANNFYSWPIPGKIRQSNIYACMVLAGSEDAEDVEYDEKGEEKLTDQNKYHRVRVLREHKDGTCDCYLPDHGHNETLSRGQLRDIDPKLNITLSYQAVMARLHGLDNLPDKLKPMAVRLLIKLLTNGATLFAVKKGTSAEKMKDDPRGFDVTVTNRVRKIISCLNDVHPSTVAKLYQDIYGESLENVEELIKNIPGYGYWREILEVDLVDTSQDEDVNINEFVLATIEDMHQLQSTGGNVENVWRDLFCSDTSQTDTDSGSLLEELEDFERNQSLQDNIDLVDSGLSKVELGTQPSHERWSVQDLPASTETDNSVKPAQCTTLYTWGAKPETPGDPASTGAASPVSSVCDNCQLPKFWSYPLVKFVSVQIVRVENPSDFVAIPMEQRGALEKLEMAIAQYFSVNKEEGAATYSDNVLYAVKTQDVYRRAVYVGLLEDVVKVFFPDHHCFDTVPPSQLLPLPQQFYSLPFLARKMRLGGIQPQGQDWPAHVVQWFKTTIGNKSLFALVTGEDSKSGSQCIPATLVVRLIDTSGSEDLVVDEYMESQGMAVCDPSSDWK